MAVIPHDGRTGERLGGIVDLVEAGPPFARNERALVVVQDVDDAELAVSFLDRTSDRFIGTAGWSGEAVFHRAQRTTLPDGRAGYLVGPEVTSCLRLNATFRIATRSGLSAEITSKVRTFQGPVPKGVVQSAAASAPAQPTRSPPPVDPPPPPPPADPPPVVMPPSAPPAPMPLPVTPLPVMSPPLTPLPAAGPIAPLPLPDPPAPAPAPLPLPPAATPPLALPPEASPAPVPLPLAPSPSPGPLPLPASSTPPAQEPAALQPLPIPTGPRKRPWGVALLLVLLALAGGAVAFFALAPIEWQLQACRYGPEIGPCEGAPPLAGILSGEAPCDRSTALAGWIAAHPRSRFRPIAESRRVEAEAACIEFLFAQGKRCLAASPCSTTCFDPMRARNPFSIHEIESRALERSSRDSPACRPVPPPPPPPPPPQPRRSDTWLRCERLMAPSWDPDSPPGARADNPTRQDGDSALPACQAALAEATGADRRVALFRLGRAQQFATRRADARQTYTDAIAAGSAAAAYALGLMNFNDQPPSRYREAAANFEIAARAGIARAKAALAGLLNAGEGGVPTDYPRAVRLAREAADEGVGFGARVLGQIYEDGHGVPASRTEACRWFARGAELGDEMSRTLYNQRCR